MNELNTYITPKELLYLDPRRQEEKGRPRGVDNEIKNTQRDMEDCNKKGPEQTGVENLHRCPNCQLVRRNLGR